ncbi:MAG TPA: transcription antitermination factor NusB [Nocardioides sp.]|jgi:16S rRNA (cytosine967-C5)-methyltransferase|nr:transcription antitermination factor NusB [Nocardioides sp.]
MSGRADPARRAAFEVLKAVRVKDAYTNLVLPHVLGKHRLTGRDAAFVTELVSGTIRGQGTYDAILAACTDRPLVSTQAKVLDVLRLGCHQLLGMRVATHAAISTSVDLVRSEVGPGAAGFANAVLRKVSEHDRDEWVRRVAPDPATDPIGFAATAYSHPRWVVEALAKALGGAPGELESLLAADNEPPAVTLVARPGRAGVTELGGEPTAFSPYGAVSSGGNPGDVPAVAEGRAGVQDEGSQLVAHALAVAPVEGADQRWLDLCAGPGGKAALLAALAVARGARVVANERLPHRADLVRRTLAGADGVEAVTVEDGTSPPWPAGSFDRVLVDAPCTGLGALRRRPEARWRRQPEDLRDLVPLQRALLDRALDLVRPGGVVVYATCSPVLAETGDVVGGVLVGRDDVKLGDAGSLLTAAAGLRADVTDCSGPLAGTVQLWPHRHGTDAMFLAVLHRPL